MVAEYCPVQKKFFFEDRPQQEILKIEICIRKKTTNIFIMLIRLLSKLPKTIKKYSFLQKC